MKKYLLGVFAVLVLATSSGTAQGFVVGGSNLGFSGYPDPQCIEPSMPFGRDKFTMDIFNTELNRYTQCIKEYLASAENDQMRIRDKYNDVVNSYNYFMTTIKNTR